LWKLDPAISNQLVDAGHVKLEMFGGALWSPEGFAGGFEGEG
jgi:hypothetical protein